MNTCLTDLTTKISIWTSVCTSMKERICINGLIFRALGDTKFSLIVSKRTWRTCFYTFICRVITPVKLRTFFNTSSCCLISIRDLASDIWTTTYTLPCWWVSKISWLLTIIHTNIILIVVIRWWWALENTFVCGIVSTWKRYRKTFIHASLIVIISKWICTVF